MNYKIINCTVESLQNSYNNGELVNGNYVFIIDLYPKPICVSTSIENCETIVREASNIVDIFATLNLGTLFLVKPEDAPEKGVRQDEVVTSIAFTEECFRLVMEAHCPSNLRLLCFHVAKHGISSEVTRRRILARTFDDLSYRGIDCNGSDRLTTVIPHQGDLSYLNSCLDRICDSATSPGETWVYFDEELTPAHFELANEYALPKFRKIHPPNSGPYVSRNHCIEHSNTDYVCFQDSDDLPTYERFTEILRFINENPMVDMAGCHELRVDELDEKVIAIRFPINVSQALGITASHPLFHPTAFVKNRCVKKAGLFSTLRRYGADSQFLLRAHFFMDIRNIDKFLYVRRRRAGSLTTSPKTRLGSADRTKLDVLWKTDFELVKNGKKSLNNSSLLAEHLAFRVEFEEINV